MFLLFDIGGTKTRLALSRDKQTLEKPAIIPTSQDFSQAMADIAASFRELAGSDKIVAAAGGMPGPMDPEHTMTMNAPNLSNWDHKPLKAELEKIFEAPVIIENDTTMAGLGEIFYGAARNYQENIVAYLTISSGVGGRRFVSGQPEPSAFGFEPGHMIIDLDGLACNCTLAGHVEGLVSGNGIARHHEQAAENITDPQVWQAVTHSLAAGLNNVTVMWSPHCIVLGGSVMQSISIAGLKAEVEKIGNVFKQYPTLVAAELGDTSGLYGALAYLTQNPRLLV